MRYVLMISFFGLLMWSDYTFAGSRNAPLSHSCEKDSRSSGTRVVTSLCAKNKVFRIAYEKKSTQIALMFGQRKMILQKIRRQYDPSLVGGDVFIGFLPESLQPYKKNNVLVYVSAIRTNGGGGGGQCGSGSEIYLNFLDIDASTPKIKSSILIGSCIDSIEVFDQNMSDGTLGDISVTDEALSLHFLNYRNLQGSPVARVAPDFAQLLFE